MACLLLCGCTTCRVTSVEDAGKFANEGYQTRIAVYKVGTDGLIVGMGLWDHHAQAQVLVGNEWKWVNMDSFHDSPAFSIENNEIYYWRPVDYAAFLKQKGKYY